MQLVNHGFTHITLAVNHFSKLIMAYFGSGESLGVKIDYSLEEVELGTIGPLTLIKDLPNDFLVMNGDILSDINYQVFYDTHIQNKREVSVAAYKRQQKIDFGILNYNDSCVLTGFEEKPSMNIDVSMGIYCLNKLVVEKLKKNCPYSFDTLMLDRLSSNQMVALYPFAGYWLDIGRPEDYEKANEEHANILSKLGIK